ncbi:hypothetical protein BgiBS90_014459, partial [Biomphalaria glabrata]
MDWVFPEPANDIWYSLRFWSESIADENLVINGGITSRNLTTVLRGCFLRLSQQGSAYSGVPETSAYSGIPETSAYSRVPETSAYSGVPETSAYSGVPETSAYSGVPETSAYSGVPETSAYSGVPETSAKIISAKSCWKLRTTLKRT